MRDGAGRCGAHKVTAGTFADKRRGSRHERGYGSAWDRIRRRILTRDGGICQPCLRQGHVHVGTHVDHKVGKAEWRRRHGNLDGVDADDNLEVINADCHEAKTRGEAARARGQAAGNPQGGAESLAPGGSGTEGFGGFLRAQVAEVGGVDRWAQYREAD